MLGHLHGSAGLAIDELDGCAGLADDLSDKVVTDLSYLLMHTIRTDGDSYGGVMMMMIMMMMMMMMVIATDVCDNEGTMNNVSTTSKIDVKMR
jgi:hypothetical protein